MKVMMVLLHMLERINKNVCLHSGENRNGTNNNNNTFSPVVRARHVIFHFVRVGTTKTHHIIIHIVIPKTTHNHIKHFSTC